jgi:hypothetical protein
LKGRFHELEPKYVLLYLWHHVFFATPPFFTPTPGTIDSSDDRGFENALQCCASKAQHLGQWKNQFL